MKRAALLGSGVFVYAVAAWTVAPGFYEGFVNPQPYNWVCPPPALAPGNIAPTSGHLDMKVIDGISDPNSAFTDDSQVAVGFLPGAFDGAGKSTISVDIAPLSPCPNPRGLHFATNTYLITATAQLTKSANLILLYSSDVPAPSNIYFASSLEGQWTSIGAAPTAQIGTIDQTIRQLGYFAAGYPANAIGAGGASQLLPIAVAVLILAVLTAGIPLALLRRRRGAGVVDDMEEADG